MTKINVPIIWQLYVYICDTGQSPDTILEVDLDTFRKLVPRYQDADRALEYINSLRAEYAAKILMEHPDYSIDDIAGMCGFTSTASFNSVFRFAFGITPTTYLNSMRQMFKKKLI